MSYLQIITNSPKKYGLNTIRTIINRYAPPNENNIEGYISRASKEIGIDANDSINTQLKNVTIPLAVAIVNIEIGYQPYSEKVFENAWLLL